MCDALVAVGQHRVDVAVPADIVAAGELVSVREGDPAAVETPVRRRCATEALRPVISATSKPAANVLR